MRTPVLLVTDDGQLSRAWPFVADELERRAGGSFDVRIWRVDPGADLDLEGVDALAVFGGDPSVASLDASSLRVAGGVTESRGPTNIEWFWANDIPWIEATSAWAASVAELALGLIICGLRRIPYWHRRVADGWVDWTYPHAQFCDDPNLVSGTLDGKTVGVVGLGAIGARIAAACHHLGAHVCAFDPHVTLQRFIDVHAQGTDLDDLIDSSDILVVAVPPTPSALGMLDAERIDRLRRGAMVVSVTRTAALDCTALRRRVTGGGNYSRCALFLGKTGLAGALVGVRCHGRAGHAVAASD